MEGIPQSPLALLLPTHLGDSEGTKGSYPRNEFNDKFKGELLAIDPTLANKIRTAPASPARTLGSIGETAVEAFFKADGWHVRDGFYNRRKNGFDLVFVDDPINPTKMLLVEVKTTKEVLTTGKSISLNTKTTYSGCTVQMGDCWVNAVADKLILSGDTELIKTGNWIKNTPSIKKDKILVAVDGNGEMFLNLLE